MWRYSRSSSDLKRAHPDTPVPYQCQRAVEDIRIQLRFCHGFDSRTEQAIRPELRTPFHCMCNMFFPLRKSIPYILHSVMFYIDFYGTDHVIQMGLPSPSTYKAYPAQCSRSFSVLIRW
ncbi:unnamed protein product [Leuciscus chuanchicus]